MPLSSTPLHCPCMGKYFTNIFTYEAPPDGEVRFEFSSGDVYRRELMCCNLCGHFVSSHNLDISALYTGDYVSANYQDEAGIRRNFERIILLDPSRSDNTGRVKRILEFAEAHFGPADLLLRPLSLLDIGSGLGVFPYKMKEAGWDCTALDPDPRAVRHAQTVVGVRSICADFMSLSDLNRFDVITFNKVLEHVEDPVTMLAKSANYVHQSGFVYVELPDGEMAITEGPGREEFFIDHLHVFSMTSMTLLANRAGFGLKMVERLREPSTKCTIRAFLVPL